MSDFTIRNISENGLVVSANGCDVVIRKVEGRLVIKALVYDEERQPELTLEPCWPTTVTAIP